MPRQEATADRVDDPVECIFGDGPAWGRFYLDNGCVNLRNTQDQPLCINHAITATPMQGFELVECFVVECEGPCPVCGQEHKKEDNHGDSIA